MPLPLKTGKVAPLDIKPQRKVPSKYWIVEYFKNKFKKRVHPDNSQVAQVAPPNHPNPPQYTKGTRSSKSHTSINPLSTDFSISLKGSKHDDLDISRSVLDDITLTSLSTHDIRNPMSILLSFINIIYLTKPLIENSRQLLLNDVAPQLMDITKVFLIDLDLKDIIIFLEKIILKNPNITHLILKRSLGDYFDTTNLEHLLNIIQRMEKITHLELSNFKIELSDFKVTDSHDKDEFMDLFKNILEKPTLTHFNFNNNVFSNAKKEEEYENFVNSYKLLKSVPSINERELIRTIVLWLFYYSGQNSDNYKYKKLLEWLYYTETDVKKKGEITREYEKVLNNSFESSKYRTFFRELWNKKIENTDLRNWFKWLFSNDNRVFYIEEDENIIERLNIIIDYFLFHTDMDMDKDKDMEIEFSIVRSNIIDFLEKIGVISKIIKEYNDNLKTLIPKYTPSTHNLTKMYEGFITHLVMKKKLITFKTSTITKTFNTAVGGRKTKSKSRKQPKKAREEPKKTLNKPSKKPTKKVALKEPNVYGVIKHKIRI
jgi:hypothetical protein